MSWITKAYNYVLLIIPEQIWTNMEKTTNFKNANNENDWKIESDAIATIICDIQIPASNTPCIPMLMIDMRMASHVDVFTLLVNIVVTYHTKMKYNVYT